MSHCAHASAFIPLDLPLTCSTTNYKKIIKNNNDSKNNKYNRSCFLLDPILKIKDNCLFPVLMNGLFIIATVKEDIKL